MTLANNFVTYSKIEASIPSALAHGYKSYDIANMYILILLLMINSGAKLSLCSRNIIRKN